MSTLELSAFNGTESVESTKNHSYDASHYVVRAGPDYGDLVARIVEQRDVTAGEAKEIIAKDGRHTVLLEVQSND